MRPVAKGKRQCWRFVDAYCHCPTRLRASAVHCRRRGFTAQRRLIRVAMKTKLTVLSSYANLAPCSFAAGNLFTLRMRRPMTARLFRVHSRTVSHWPTASTSPPSQLHYWPLWPSPRCDVSSQLGLQVRQLHREQIRRRRGTSGLADHAQEFVGRSRKPVSSLDNNRHLLQPGLGSAQRHPAKTSSLQNHHYCSCLPSKICRRRHEQGWAESPALPNHQTPTLGRRSLSVWSMSHIAEHRLRNKRKILLANVTVGYRRQSVRIMEPWKSADNVTITCPRLRRESENLTKITYRALGLPVV
jgi:hypothetical protein